MARRDTDIWMPLAIGAYLGKTMHLTTLHHGAYLLLLMDYWKRGPLPSDQTQLAAICKMDASSIAWADAWRVLAPFFELGEDGLLHNERADLEIAKADANHSSAKTKATNAANARWNKQSAKDAPSIAQAMPRNAPSPSPNTSWGNGEFHQLQYAAYVLQELELPDTKLLKETIAAAIVAKATSTGNPKEACARWLIAQAQSYKTSSEFKSNKRKNWVNWFANANYDDDPAKWEQIDGKNQPVRVERISAQTARIERNRQASADFLREIYPDIAMAEPGGGAIPPRHPDGSPDAILAQEPVVIPPRSH